MRSATSTQHDYQSGQVPHKCGCQTTIKKPKGVSEKSRTDAEIRPFADTGNWQQLLRLAAENKAPGSYFRGAMYCQLKQRFHTVKLNSLILFWVELS